MRAIILAAGRGSRLKDITSDRPKCLVEVKGKPLLEWQAEALRAAGITEIAVVRGYLGEMLEPYKLTLFDNPRWMETNMVVSLTCAAEWLRNGPCIVSYADIFYEPETVGKLAASPAPIAITYDRQWQDLWKRRFGDKILEDAETFRIDGNGHVLEIGNKPQTLEEIQGQYMGLLKFTPEGWRTVEDYLAQQTQEARDKLHMTGLLSRLISSGKTVSGVPVDGGWGEVDNAEDLALYNTPEAA